MYKTLESLHPKKINADTILERAAQEAGGTTAQPKQIQHKRTSTHRKHLFLKN